MLSRISPWLLGLAFLGLAVAATVMPISSDTVPYVFLFDRSEVKNDPQRFLNNVVADSGVTRADLQPQLTHLRPLEKQLPIVLFLARESGKPVAEIVTLRKSSHDWLEVLKKAGLKPKVLFEGVEGKFPEPYKAAWTEFRMKRDPDLNDDQVRELILLQTAHRLSGEPMEEIVKGETKGRTTEVLIARAKAPTPEASAEPVKASQSSPAPAPAKAKLKRGGVRAR
jgi:hypothetical protein